MRLICNNGYYLVDDNGVRITDIYDDAFEEYKYIIAVKNNKLYFFIDGLGYDGDYKITIDNSFKILFDKKLISLIDTKKELIRFYDRNTNIILKCHYTYNLTLREIFKNYGIKIMRKEKLNVII